MTMTEYSEIVRKLTELERRAIRFGWDKETIIEELAILRVHYQNEMDDLDEQLDREYEDAIL